MRFSGSIHTRNEERGFGFIRPAGGGQDVFVHVSSLPGGQWPAAGEVLTFEVAADPSGRKKAVQVRLQQSEVAGLQADRLREQSTAAAPRQQHQKPKRERSTGVRATVFALVVLCGFWLYANQQKAAQRLAQEPAAPARAVQVRPAPPPGFRCDGRNKCSQMTSCEEARSFLKHCPAQETDGDGDGVPCEQQWCS